MLTMYPETVVKNIKICEQLSLNMLLLVVVKICYNVKVNTYVMGTNLYYII